MGERSRAGSNLVNTDTTNDDKIVTDVSGQSNVDKIAEIMKLVEPLEYPDLLRLRDLIGNEYTRKAEEARAGIIAETQRKLSELGLTLEDVLTAQQKHRRASGIRVPATPKYRSPDGKMWSGRGATPKWIREYEEGGGNREDYLIK